MDIHKQKCQKCQSVNVINYIYRSEARPDEIFVQCADCDELVAKYTLTNTGYYHHHKGFESFLRAIERSGESISFSTIENMFATTKKEIINTFNKILQSYKK